MLKHLQTLTVCCKVYHLVRHMDHPSQVVVKAAGEGNKPSNYLFGEDWNWNIFDSSLVLISFVMMG